MQKRNYCIVFHSPVSDFITNLTNLDAPATKKLTLAFRYVLIQNVHAQADSIASSCVWVTSASRASRKASAIASLLNAPCHSSIIASHAIPLSNCSSTSFTEIRVPLKMGAPWQIAGSETMYRPKCFSFMKSPFFRAEFV